MEATKILTADFLDILFENRNKQYGAYALRISYNKRLMTALIVTFILGFGVIMLLSKLSLSPKEATLKPFEMHEYNLQAVDQTEKAPDLPKPVEKTPSPQIKSTAFVIPKIVADKLVTQAPPSQTEMAESKISTVTMEGIKDDGAVHPPAIIDDKAILDIKKYTEDDEPFVNVQIDATYPGGVDAWRNFLERNLHGEAPVDNSAPFGTYNIIIQFIVDKDGIVSDIKPLTHFGYGMEDEAIRVIKKSGRWKPAIQNGRQVKAYRKQPVIFRVMEQ